MNARRRQISGIAVTAVTALGLGTLSACSSEGAAAGNTDKFDVVALVYPMQFLAERIGGDHVHVTTLTEPGEEPHDLELSTRQTAELGEADAVLYLKSLQPAVDKAVDQSGVKTKIDAASLTTLEEHAADDGHDHGGGGEEEEHARDPHIWLDPVKYAEVAAGVGQKAFEKADPDHAADYRRTPRR
ncbi:High-affinity zinc uptake system protein ZnuA OS=Streptomyces fumanus OX=67302 GN=GCM10018772_02970 PE=3 SV=1 [Streptomyces fumanus]